MFSNSDSQYISVIKYHNQLKIDYKLLNQDEITSSNQTSFLLHDEFMPQDVFFKLNSWQQELAHTYIATVCCSNEQIIIPINDASKNESYNIVPLNTSFNVGIKKSTLFESVNYFDKTGLDFLYSPYHVLNLHVEQNSCGNHLLILLVDNYLYLLILNENNEIVHSDIKILTSFDDIKETEFYDSEVIGQKLFDEVYYYEIQDLIQSVIVEFYELQSDVFIEKIVILYTLKQLNDQQIYSLKNELLIDISYHPISIDESLFELSKQNLTSSKSFIQPRQKIQKKNSSVFTIAAVIITIALAGVVYYFQTNTNDKPINKQEISKKVEVNQKEIVKEEEIKPAVVEKKIELPNHIVKNRDIEKRLLTIFDIIPYDVLLKEITLKEDESVIDATYLKDDIYVKSMKDSLSKLYKYSELKFDDIEASILNASIFNSQRIVEKDPQEVKLPKYIKDKFLPQERVYEQLKVMFPQNGIIKFQSTFKSDVLTYNYTVNIIVDTPLEFFEIIEDINKEFYSMNISYPILLRKTIDGIEIEFNFQFHQYL